MDSNKQYNCYFELTLDIMGGKWKPIILYYINSNGVARHSDLKRFIPSINERMLTRQLRELETDLLIKRKVYPVVPPKVEYSLTEYGKSLIPILSSLVQWGKDYANSRNFTNFKMDISNKNEELK
ncbi:winged helix-turn-helix transcriptional regulator [Fusobacterium perfoetens]|uniref:winged helix-turn-helix transcriptional regulator n=1 Tax=Fusobacterium perfoetens TaxID=852 RepID=UPI00048A1B3D|nr:helix-turn-helix domain-containing protein [Fusobacterium perfoetens]MCI6151733.1 helix-turn-helix transcriptional regulator [Fusobacterium perfoetens]MDY3237849.1 helix-turn-helix domain-containing protein [Fusobacterium perfoetens]